MSREHVSSTGLKSVSSAKQGTSSTASISEAESRAALPRSLCRGTLPFGEVECHVLENGERIISSRGFVVAFASDQGGSKNANSERQIARILKDSDAFKVDPRVEFVANGGKHLGYPAELLVDVCDSYIDGLIDGTLHPKQIPLAHRARQIQRAFAKLGIIALVDEVTGFQEQREKNALQLKLNAFLLDDPAEWERMFKPEFYTLLSKLYRVKFPSGKRPAFFGWFTRKFVYAPVLDVEVANELDVRNPEPRHGSNHHQHLTPNARVLLARQIDVVMVLMKQSEDFADFQNRYNVQFCGGALQLSLKVA